MMRNKMLATNGAPRIEGGAGSLAKVLAPAGASGGTKLCSSSQGKPLARVVLQPDSRATEGLNTEPEARGRAPKKPT